MDAWVVARALIQLAAMAAAGALLIAGYRWLRTRSTAIAVVVAAAILLRAGVGTALFWLSYLELPFASAAQVGGGFWQQAQDATGYYQVAVNVVATGQLAPLNHAVAAPLYVNLLGGWMALVGVSPAAGLFLNLLLYMALVILLVRAFKPVDDWRRDLPCVVGISAYSLSPVIVFHSTQTLKDELLGLLIVMACIGVLEIGRYVRGDAGWRVTPQGIGLVTVAIFGAAAIRWYFAFIMIAALAVVLLAFAVRGRRIRLAAYAAVCAAVLAGGWAGLWAGAGPYYWAVAPDPQRLWELPRRLLTSTEVARSGFVSSGGATNIVVSLRDDPTEGAKRYQRLTAEQREAMMRANGFREAAGMGAEVRQRQQQILIGPPGPTRATSGPPPRRAPVPPNRGGAMSDEYLALARATPVTFGDQIKVVLSGLAVVFVPLSALEPILGFSVPVGRALLTVADIDTLFLDAATIAVLGLLWTRRRQARQHALAATFAIVLSVATAVLLGYVVTNFGTLWRMRALIAVPLWAVVVTLTPQQLSAGPAPAARRRAET